MKGGHDIGLTKTHEGGKHYITPDIDKRPARLYTFTWDCVDSPDRTKREGKGQERAGKAGTM